MNKDLISREALKKAFENLASDGYNEPIWYQQTVFETIDNAPTITEDGAWNFVGENQEKWTATKERDAYMRGYEQGFAEEYDRASRKTPTFPMVSTSPAFIDIPQACKNCPKHPSNGGDGICHCTLGTQPVYSNTSFTSINTGTHYGLDTFIAEDIRGDEE